MPTLQFKMIRLLLNHGCAVKKLISRWQTWLNGLSFQMMGKNLTHLEIGHLRLLDRLVNTRNGLIGTISVDQSMSLTYHLYIDCFSYCSTTFSPQKPPSKPTSNGDPCTTSAILSPWMIKP